MLRCAQPLTQSTSPVRAPQSAKRVFRAAIAALLTGMLALAAMLAVGAPQAYADSAGDLIAKTNGARASSGLGGYSVAGDLTAIAQRHAESMASSRTIDHNASLNSQACCWRSIGENVGVGPSASAVHNAFMNSSSHRANILSSAYTEIGVGTARGSDGQIYVDEVFRERAGGGSSHPKAAPKSAKPTYTKRASAAAPIVHRAPRVTRAEMLKHRLHKVVADRKRARDPVAAAYEFATLMAKLAR